MTPVVTIADLLRCQQLQSIRSARFLLGCILYTTGNDRAVVRLQAGDLPSNVQNIQYQCLRQEGQLEPMPQSATWLHQQTYK